jgi:cyclophilin family peptidyl-prolyl cis-trans isomerase
LLPEPYASNKKLPKYIVCGFENGIDQKLINRLPMNIYQGDKMDETIVVFQTTKGDFEVALDSKNAPITVANFLRYVNEKFYDGTIFHRVIPRFMVQGGGFTAEGTEKETHEAIKLESKNGLKNVTGSIAMARTSIPDSATSQFFISVVNNRFLDYAPGNDGYAVFGNVIAGMEVVQSIAAVKTDSRGFNENWPVSDVVILKAFVKAKI